ncbi:MAG: hypothetical protein HGB23_00405 [Chlorobiaceae bacterium]|nr:hypothetical protein [Chlorobiaceae bacterium]
MTDEEMRDEEKCWEKEKIFVHEWHEKGVGAIPCGCPVEEEEFCPGIARKGTKGRCSRDSGFQAKLWV